MEWNGVGIETLHGRLTPNLWRQEILGRITWRRCSSCLPSSVSSFSNIIVHFPFAFGYWKIMIIFPTSGTLRDILQNNSSKNLANIIYCYQTSQLWSGSTGFSAESTWTPICHMHVWQRVLDPNCNWCCTTAPGVAHLQLMFTHLQLMFTHLQLVSQPCNWSCKFENCVATGVTPLVLVRHPTGWNL